MRVCIPFCAYIGHVNAHTRCTLRTSPERASPQRSLAIQRVARPSSHSREGLVYVRTRGNLLLPLLPRYYLSHASGADFYKRSDSRGKFIKSLPPSLPSLCHLRRYTVCFHGRLERTKEKQRESSLLFLSIFFLHSDYQWRKRRAPARFRASLLRAKRKLHLVESGERAGLGTPATRRTYFRCITLHSCAHRTL